MIFQPIAFVEGAEYGDSGITLQKRARIGVDGVRRDRGREYVGDSDEAVLPGNQPTLSDYNTMLWRNRDA